MTPLSNTIYAVGLFLALVALWLWTQRRQRVVPIRQTVETTSREDAA